MDDDHDTRSSYVEETVEQISRMYDEHHRNISRIQQLADQVTGTLGRPTGLVAVLLLLLLWVVGNGIAEFAGFAPLDEVPYPHLEFIATIAALLVALLILTTQRNQDVLSEKRARLTLQIAALSEKKIAKIIELLEEQRHDNPMLPERADAAAQEMSAPSDAGNVLT